MMHNGGDDKLGSSSYTMRSSGCLVSCIAAALSMERSTEETPGTLNRRLMEDGFMVMPASAALQLLAYYVSLDKGLDVDKPRNLAKVVTVE